MHIRIVGLSAGLLLLFAVTTGLLHLRRESQHLTRLAQDRLLSIAVTAAEALDGEAHAELAKCRDRSCANFRKLAGYLRRIEQGNGLNTEIYTLVREGSQTRFIVRTRHEAQIGMPYELRPEMLAIFEQGVTASTGIYEDQYGEWMSAYAPVKDSSGRTVALLEADYKAGEIRSILRRDALELATVTLAGLVVAILLGGILSSVLVRPLSQLAEAMDAAANGGAGPPLPLFAPAELGRLARHFHAMQEAVASVHLHERLASVGRMVATIVHDVRGPLSNILGLTRILSDQQERPRRESMAHLLAKQVERITELSDDILAFSQGSMTLHLDEFAAVEFIEDILGDVRPLADERGVKLVAEIEGCASLRADRTKMARVVYNLVKNSIEASSSGSRVLVRLDSQPHRILLEVADEGKGVPSEVRPRLFDAFVTHGKPAGTGLGLAIARSHVVAHGGTIEFSSEVGVGTKFQVELPASNAAALAA
ncbi:MAG: sensor histidine kinase [Candidatus Wallbacteria bacterium]|nr:sensor histidine kinase [Candidatus Wallbacteria bacterium]